MTTEQIIATLERLADGTVIYDHERKDVREAVCLLRVLPELEKAAQALLDRLVYVHAHPAYEGVWVISQLHIGPYEGPKYSDEMNELRAALARPKESEPS